MIVLLSAIMVLLGAAIVIRTFFLGGGALALGYVVGFLLILVGSLRFYLSRGA
jgi:hypothetical protein